MEYQIVCIGLSENGNRIERVGLITEGGNPDQAKEIVPRAQVNQLIAGGHKVFFVLEGKRADVSEFGDEFIRTDKDSISHNNLRNLRSCRPTK